MSAEYTANVIATRLANALPLKRKRSKRNGDLYIVLSDADLREISGRKIIRTAFVHNVIARLKRLHLTGLSDVGVGDFINSTPKDKIVDYSSLVDGGFHKTPETWDEHKQKLQNKEKV